MYTGLFHTHKLTITIFIIIYLIKTILLLSGKKDTLTSFSKRFLPFEIVVSVLFLITGIWLLFETSEVRALFILKIAVVALAVPLAFVGFRKQNVAMAVSSFVLIIASYGIAEMNKRSMVKRVELPKDVVVDASATNYDALAHGKALFSSQCEVCHGAEGNLQMSGAKDLTASEMSRDEVVQRIREGKLTMISYEDHFSTEEIDALADYVMSFR